MAKTKTEHAPAADAAAGEADAPKKKSAVMTLVKAIAAISVIVVVEVAAAAMLFPSADETRAIGEQIVKGEHEKAGAKEGQSEDEQAEVAEDGGEHGEQSHEVSLGSYHIVSFNPKTRTTFSVDVELFGVVLAEEEPEFNELFTLHEKRINEQVTIAFRGMDLADFTDPGLGLIKRIILEKVNRALGKPLIREVVVPHLSFIPR